MNLLNGSLKVWEGTTLFDQRRREMGNKKFKPPSARKAEKKTSVVNRTIQNVLESVRA